MNGRIHTMKFLIVENSPPLILISPGPNIRLRILLSSKNPPLGKNPMEGPGIKPKTTTLPLRRDISYKYLIESNIWSTGPNRKLGDSLIILEGISRLTYGSVITHCNTFKSTINTPDVIVSPIFLFSYKLKNLGYQLGRCICR